ncbi:hypothetical protein PsyrH_P115 (plasmid) [Pseudomonas syringae pv. syringae HS191]|uniref:hypothetical protein n=1 Tax=Pseudomonas syringae TaxID=317 RepID=UPI0006247C10|nr:hypothetical protein [Pseudomonas syringae]AKF48819.1 hypothetical protein PsyrH_P115 [Pseudomonas syringae pv. syringae HS191]RML67869.1 hypothetical protein ALQ91_200046 [Pseudomonas syringae pv. syringae]
MSTTTPLLTLTLDAKAQAALIRSQEAYRAWLYTSAEQNTDSLGEERVTAALRLADEISRIAQPDLDLLIIAAAKAKRLAAWEALCSKSVAADELENWNTQLMDEVGEMLNEKLISRDEADALLLRAEIRWTAENARPDEPTQ